MSDCWTYDAVDPASGLLGEAMTKSQMNKVMSVVKRPRSQAVALQGMSLEKRPFAQLV